MTNNKHYYLPRVTCVAVSAGSCRSPDPDLPDLRTTDFRPLQEVPMGKTRLWQGRLIGRSAAIVDSSRVRRSSVPLRPHTPERFEL